MDKLDTPFRIAELIYREIRQELSSDEKKELDNWKHSSNRNQALYQQIADEDNIAEKLKTYRHFNQLQAWQNIEGSIKGNTSQKVIGLKKILRYAAMLIPIIGIGYLLLVGNPDKNQPELIKPGSSKAILIMADGKEVILENQEFNTMLKEEKIKVHNHENTLSYTNEQDTIPVLMAMNYNTLRTPRGGEYQMKLEDGTRVWLNADTKLTYPTVFANKERRVQLEGEAFFEVTPNKAKPFIVETSSASVRVLGTSFNIMAYQDEPAMATTLVEGRVLMYVSDSIQSGNDLTQLTPGEQAILPKGGDVIQVRKVDVNPYTAWRKGLFVIEHESLEVLMRRLGRWYDFETEYSDSTLRKYHFSGTLGRYDNLDTILEMIAMTTKISFDKSDAKIIVNHAE